MAVWNNTTVNGVLTVTNAIYVSDIPLRFAYYGIIGDGDKYGLCIGDYRAPVGINGASLGIDNNMYGTNDPPSDGYEGQVYFKLID